MQYMSKYDLIKFIMETFEENERLKDENERLRAAYRDAIDDKDAGKEDTLMDVKASIMAYARKRIVKESLSYWHSVRVRRGDGGQLEVQSFEDWKEDKVEKIPDFMSRNDFFFLLDDELRAVYEQLKSKEFERLKEAESKEQGDD